MASESIAHEAFGLIGYWLRAHSGSLVFSVTPFKRDENKNQNLSIDKVQNLGNERR